MTYAYLLTRFQTLSVLCQVLNLTYLSGVAPDRTRTSNFLHHSFATRYTPGYIDPSQFLGKSILLISFIIIICATLSSTFCESSEKVVLAGLGALQGESLQDEPRLRGLNYCYSIPERVGRALNPPDFCTFSETSL